jgi:hypothetical protein
VPDLTVILLRLTDGGVQYVLVGGLAAVSQGAPVTTVDVDIVHERSEHNLERLARVLAALDARYRMHTAVIRPDAGALAGPGHQLLMTSLGPLDVLGSVEGGLTFEDLTPDTLTIDVDGRAIRVLRLEKLLELKRQWSDPESRLRAEVLARTLASRKP